MNAYPILNNQFTVFTDIVSGRKLAKCNYCNAMLKYHHSTSSLTYHLRCKHSVVTSATAAAEKHRSEAVVKTESASSQQRTYGGLLTNKLVQWIAKDGRPVDIVEDEGLKDLLIAAIGSRTLELPSSNAITTHLGYFYHEEKNVIKESLMATEHLALTTDSWTTGSDSYSSIRSHYISSDWQFRTALLNVEHSLDKYMAVNIDEHLSSLMSDWQIDASEKVCHMVINSLLPVNDSEAINFERTPCFAYLLQLSINNAMVACTTDEKIDSAILGYYNCFVELDPAKHLQTISKLAQIPVDQDICTLWRRTYLVVDCLIQNKAELTDQPSDEEWKDIVNLHKLYEPLERAISILGGDNYTTASSILPLIAYLKQQMAVVTTDSKYAQEFKKVFLSQFNTSLENVQDIEGLQISIALDIRYKRLLSISSDKRAGVWSLLKSMTKGLSEASGETIAKKPKRSILSLAGDEEGLEGEDDGANEFEMYKHLPQINDDDQCPLQWWRQNATAYPTLSKIAKKYLAIPATSVPCEQIFSDARDKLNRKRSALLPDDVGTTLCLSDWLSCYKYPSPGVTG